MQTTSTPPVFFLSLMNGAAWGGSEELWYRSAMLLAKKGAVVGCAVYDREEKTPRLNALREAGCRVFLLPDTRINKSSGALRILKKIAAQYQLQQAIRKLPLADFKTVVINQGGFEVYTTAWQKLLPRLQQFVLLFHNYNEADTFSQRQKTTLKKWLKQSSANFFAAHRIQVFLEKQLGMPINNALLLHNPLSFSPPATITPMPLHDGPFVMAVFAALEVNRKGQDKLLKILAVEDWKQRNWQLYLYGEGRDEILLHELIVRYNLKKNVFIKGHTNDVAKAMQAAHIILQLTNVDAMPLSVIEAMAMARPLVVTDIGDMPQWVRPGINGWVSKVDEISIGNCLEEAWQNRNDWAAMGQRSYKIFQQEFPACPEEKFLQQVLAIAALQTF